ncbi:hypothetical protein BH23BAC1_BH23BAC1_19370 [soil metagenome]
MMRFSGFFLEGFSEYLALQANKEVFGEEFYRQQLKNYIEYTADLDVVPVSEIKNSDEIDDTYRYSYVPLLLSAFEKEIGMENMWKWMQTILKTPQPVKTHYEFFKSSLVDKVISREQFKKLEARFINNPDAWNKIIETINRKP